VFTGILVKLILKCFCFLNNIFVNIFDSSACLCDLHRCVTGIFSKGVQSLYRYVGNYLKQTKLIIISYNKHSGYYIYTPTYNNIIVHFENSCKHNGYINTEDRQNRLEVNANKLIIIRWNILLYTYYPSNDVGGDNMWLIMYWINKIIIWMKAFNFNVQWDRRVGSIICEQKCWFQDPSPVYITKVLHTDLF